ncbi:tRNA (guanosine(46)-N7)-methyltransferase TrmB [Salinithrix halophila]|uniref:tRNA (guanine-N(7)-)-methyltransferase n=1 Tax=Salinithrix halophila TaxID=1485204 RepID=A0ABV8JEZ6_9BACL
MRLRRKPQAQQMVRKHPRVILDPERVRGYWKAFFGNNHPLFLELGTGKGQFLSRACQQHTEINWIGVERIEEVLLHALQKADETGCGGNLRFLWLDAKKLDEVFAEGEVDRIHLHFSDPWPKKRHAKRRLTDRRFLEQYRRMLKKDGFLQLKTDNEDLFNFSLEELAKGGFQVTDSTSDLYDSSFDQENIPTEYEEKFTSQGMPIHFLRARHM